jgi:hypothetical protein
MELIFYGLVLSTIFLSPSVCNLVSHGGRLAASAAARAPRFGAKLGCWGGVGLGAFATEFEAHQPTAG